LVCGDEIELAGAQILAKNRGTKTDLQVERAGTFLGVRLIVWFVALVALGS